MQYFTKEEPDFLLAVDFSQPTKRAFDAAIRMARVFKANLHILHVNEEEMLFAGHSSDELTDFIDDIAKRRASWMQSFESRAEELGVEISSILRTGDPSSKILEVAKELDASLIVIGTQKIGNILSGSVAKKILRETVRPVMLISRMAGVAPAESGGTFDHIVYPTDFSEASRNGIKLAKILVDKTDAKLTLTSVVRVPRIIPTLPGEPPLILPDRAADHLVSNLREQMDSLASAVDHEHLDSEIVVHSSPAEGINQIAYQGGVDLIVMPTHSTHGLGSTFFGRTAENLSQIARVPVLLFNPNNLD